MALAAAATPAWAEYVPSWTSSCTKAGRTLYLERTAERPTASRELELHRRYPNAVCLVLAPEEAGGTPGDLAAALQQSRPGGPAAPVLSFAAPAAPLPDAGIDAALRALTGSGLPVSPRPDVPSLDKPLGVEVQAETEDGGEALRPAHSDWVRVAVYRDVSDDVALADWDRALAHAPFLATYAPDIKRFDGDRVMLSVGPLPAAEAASFCIAAAEAGLECLPGSGPPSAAADGPALEAMAMSYPGHVAWGVAESSCARAAPAQWPGDGPTCMGGPVPPRRPWVDLTALGEGAEAPKPVAQRMPKAGAGSSSAAALASNLPTSRTTSPRVRPTSALMK